MAPRRFMSEIDFTKTQLAIFFVVLLLSIDEINPVKIFLRVFPALSPWHVAGLCILLMSYAFISEMKNLVYLAVKIFFHSILSIFFRDVDIIGRENIPQFGPVIFTVNHANQFIDAVMVLCTCQHKVSYLMAENSWKRPIIGHLAWALDVVPVKRAQDEAKPGTGKVTLHKSSSESSSTESTEIEVQGTDSLFVKELAPGDKIRLSGTAAGFKVKAIENEKTLTLEGDDVPADFSFPTDTPVAFDVLKRIDTKIVFEKVLDKLADGGAVGIFPEGGSHDRTDLLPLKVGVALVAYSALEKDGLSIPIVPVGLNYFKAYRWRGRAVVEYGQPIYVDPATLKDYKAGGHERREVCNQLLENIEASMRSVIVSAPDYETLELIHTARRLYQRKKGPLDSSEKQDLSRRFAEGYRRLLLMTDGKPPEKWLELQERIIAYRSELKYLGIKDYQVPSLAGKHLDEDIDVQNVDGDKILALLQLSYQILHLLFLLTVAAVPVLFLNLPVGILAGLYAESRRKRALANSKVKIRATDVMLTEKVVFCIVMVPTLWIGYGVLLYFSTDLDVAAIALAILSMPLFAYSGIIVVEAGIVDWKDLRPLFMRLLPSTGKRLAAMPAMRKSLQEDLRAFIKSIGPGLGEIYYGKDVDWTTIQEASRQGSTDKGATDKKSN